MINWKQFTARKRTSKAGAAVVADAQPGNTEFGDSPRGGLEIRRAADDRRGVRAYGAFSAFGDGKRNPYESQISRRVYFAIREKSRSRCQTGTP